MAYDFAPHNLTSNTPTAPYIISASTAYASLPPYKAFDNAIGGSGYFVTNAVSTGWIQIYFNGGYYTLNNYSIRVNTIPEPNRAPKDWTMQGSVDGTTFTILDTVTNQTTWASGETRNFVCESYYKVQGYKYFRINVTANNGDSYLQFGEIYLYGDTWSPNSSLLMYRGHNRLNMLPISLGMD